MANALADPMLELRDSNGTLLVTDNNWADNPSQAAELTSSGLAPVSNLESAIAAPLPPGAYTALVLGENNGTGVGLVSGNTILNNQLLNNGLPGVTFHSHVGPNFHLPADNLNDNVIIGNRLSGNGPDLGGRPRPG